jgi:diguanylate cyclase (GGDEF)-like protein
MTAKLSPLLFVLTLLYAASALLGMQAFSMQPSNITILWLPAGIGLVMVLRFGVAALPMVLLASFAVNYDGMASGDHALLHTFVAASADTLAAWLSAVMMQRLLPNGLDRLYDLVPFALGVCLLPTLVSGLIIAGNLAWGAYITWSHVPEFVLILLVSDGFGILLVYSLYQSFLHFGVSSWSEWRKGVLYFLLALGLVLLAYQGFPFLVYLVLPVLLLLAFRVHMPVVISAMVFLVLAIILLSAQDFGPFVQQTVEHSILMLVFYLAATVFITLSIALHNRALIDAELSSSLWRDKAEHDVLTGLLNRAAFFPLLEQALQAHHYQKRMLSLAVVDIDWFKRINDTYGHDVGDEVLRALANELLSRVRAQDIVARLGGEEFIVLLPHADAQQANIVLERMRESVSHMCVQAEGHEIHLTISIGCVSCLLEQVQHHQLYQLADKALYQAKSSGRNQVCLLSCE